jgi:hypothetical protein
VQLLLIVADDGGDGVASAVNSQVSNEQVTRVWSVLNDVHGSRIKVTVNRMTSSIREEREREREREW